MNEAFLKILNMSLSASILAVAVGILRFLLAKKAPKWLFPALWGLVGVRLLLFAPPESMFSLIPSASPIPVNIETMQSPAIETNIPVIDGSLNPVVIENFTPETGASVNPLQVWVRVGAILWLIGLALMLLYAALSTIQLAGRMKTAVRVRDNVYESEFCNSPFVLGVFRPRIYLPRGLTESEADYVIAHENAHIRRRDHWIKPLGFLLLSVHWFNPLLWIVYILLSRDIELACDARVIADYTPDERADYSETLLRLSSPKFRIAACPLAFGEVGVKTRVKSVLNYKRPAFWVVLTSVILVIVLVVCFLTNPVSAENPWTQEYIPGTGNIQGEVDADYFKSIHPDFEIGADKYGYAVFKDPKRAWDTFVFLYGDAIQKIQEDNGLSRLTNNRYVYVQYKTYGWQTENGTAEEIEACRFVSRFLDIYENSFEDHSKLAEAAEPTREDTVLNGNDDVYWWEMIDVIQFQNSIDYMVPESDERLINPYFEIRSVVSEQIVNFLHQELGDHPEVPKDVKLVTDAKVSLVKQFGAMRMEEEVYAEGYIVEYRFRYSSPDAAGTDSKGNWVMPERVYVVIITQGSRFSLIRHSTISYTLPEIRSMVTDKLAQQYNEENSFLMAAYQKWAEEGNGRLPEGTFVYSDLTSLIHTDASIEEDTPYLLLELIKSDISNTANARYRNNYDSETRSTSFQILGIELDNIQIVGEKQHTENPPESFMLAGVDYDPSDRVYLIGYDYRIRTDAVEEPVLPKNWVFDSGWIYPAETEYYGYIRKEPPNNRGWGDESWFGKFANVTQDSISYVNISENLTDSEFGFYYVRLIEDLAEEYLGYSKHY